MIWDQRVRDLDIKIDNNLATISGIAYNQSTKEKVFLVVGNQVGIVAVDDQMTSVPTEPEA